MGRSILALLLLYTCDSFCQNYSKGTPLRSDTTVNLYAFIGRKISVTKFDPNSQYKVPIKIEIDSTNGDTIRQYRSYVMDNAFEAKYEVIVSVFNILKSDTVTFNAYDHYGRPGFDNYQTVLLYISKSADNTSYFHQKYQFDPVHLRKDGKWIGENGKSPEELFSQREKAVFKARGLFKN